MGQGGCLVISDLLAIIKGSNSAVPNLVLGLSRDRCVYESSQVFIGMAALLEIGNVKRAHV